MSFYKEVPGRKTTLESTLKFDTEPKAGSTNPVTSEGVNTAITDAVGGASDALQEQIDDIAEKAGSGYTPKGEATVATLNGLSGQENGELYTMTDAGTLTDGTLAVVAGDTVAWDEANSVWYKAMDYAPRQYGTNEVHNLATTATEADLVAGNFLAIDVPGGGGATKKLPGNMLPASKIIDRGRATVSMINALTFKQDGWKFFVADSGTISQGSLSVIEGDSVVWDSASNTWKTIRLYIPSLNKPIVASENNPASLNNLRNTGFYQLQRTSATTTTDFPSDFPTSSGPSTLEVLASTYNGQEYVFQSLTIIRTNEVWVRAKSLGVWSTWTKSGIGSSGVLKVSQSPIIGSLSNPSSLNDLKSTGYYQIQRTSATTTTDFPNDFPESSGPSTLLVIASVYNNNPFVYQVLTRIRTNEIWVRTQAEQNWSAWVKTAGGSGDVTIGSGGQYSTIREGVAAAVLIPNCKVRVLPGTYDLKTEFADVIPDVLNENTRGVHLYNGVHIVFDSGAKVLAEFDTDDGYTTEELQKISWYFNPFYAFKESFTLENLDITCKNTRYCVHDENEGHYTYTRKYINCRMKYINTLQNASARLHCIGCGLGEYGTLVIDGGSYEVETNYGLSRIDNGDVNQAQMPIMIHNGNGNNNESVIYIRNVYLSDRGFFNFRWGGDSPNITNIYINGCSTGLPTLTFRSSNSTTTSPENMETTEWCNEVRNSGYHWELDAENWNATLVAD